MTPQLEQQIAALLPTAGSLRELADMLAVNRSKVRITAAPIIERMRAAGALPPCACGKERFHRYCCSASVTRKAPPERIARREAAIDLILSGKSYREIGKRMGICDASARGFKRHLSKAQLAARAKIEADRRRKPGQSRPFGDDLYARIAAAVPRWLSPATREDVISEIYVAVLEGSLAADAIAENVGRFANAATEAYESRWRVQSLDAARFHDSERILLDSIPDPSALAAFDYIFDGEPA